MPVNDMLADRRSARRTAMDERRAARQERQGNRNLNDTVTPAGNGDAPGAQSLSPQQQALNTFYATPLYQFPLEQGLQAINANYAARGMLESGAAQKSINDYAAGMASGGLRDYMGFLGNQQALGATAASASSGVSSNYGNSMAGLNSNYANSLSGLNSNYANTVTGLNSNLANAQSSYANNVGDIYSNNAIAKANNSNAMISGIGNAFSGALGGLAYTGAFGGGGGTVYPGYLNA